MSSKIYGHGETEDEFARGLRLEQEAREHRRAYRDAKAKAEFPSLALIVEQLVACNYQCEAGPLVLNRAFLALREGARDEGCLNWQAPCGDCAWCRMFGAEEFRVIQSEYGKPDNRQPVLARFKDLEGAREYLRARGGGYGLCIIDSSGNQAGGVGEQNAL
jgi:hypothetical protein